MESANPSHAAQLHEVALVAMVAVILGLGLLRLRQPPVVGYILAGIALGAELGRRQGRRALGPALLGMAALGVAGVATWRWLPHVVALLWDQAGGQALLPGGAAVLALATGGAPIASGAVFAAALDDPEASSTSHTGRLLATNTVGSVAGAALAGLALVPAFGLRTPPVSDRVPHLEDQRVSPNHS